MQVRFKIYAFLTCALKKNNVKIIRDEHYLIILNKSTDIQDKDKINK